MEHETRFQFIGSTASATGHVYPFFEWAATPTRNSQLALRLASALLLALLLYVNTLALSNYFADPVYAKAPPWQLFHNYVKQKAKADDVMLTNFPEAAVSYYSPNGLPFYVVPVERDRSIEFRLDQTESGGPIGN